ncbi:22278_t:CDS:2 [Gigaspora margarita]|uniref:22278_t:CDS:1 n=1 Tax=Gigaspora margarita TaxID=4874 RepID=A0ABM8W748_GIGMA|nr:22278_t:CDS:2 [Gigaspora margarita]
MYQEKELTIEETKIRINEYQKRQPQGALSIFNKQNNFMGFILNKPGGKKGNAEVVYALSREYWGRGIMQSVLGRVIEEWGPEVRSIGLGKIIYEKNAQNQPIQETFQFNAEFEPVSTEISIKFNDKGFDLPSLDNKFEYCKKLEEFINALYLKGDIITDVYYSQENSKKFTFCKNSDGRIRFHYKKDVF